MGSLGRLLRRRRLEAQLDAELRDHLERSAADYRRSGLGEAEARRRAILDLGGVEPVKEACRDARGTRLLEDLGQDVGYGFRVLRKSPGFTLVAVASLALGIGANTTVFTLVDSLILRSLPVREPSRLVRLEGGSWTNPIWEQVRERQHEILESAAAYSDTRLDLASGGEARFVEAFFASGTFFDVVGVPAILGRTLTSEDDRRGGGPDGPVAVISYAFWQRRYGGSADAVGSALALNGVPFTIVGVTPPTFFGPTVARSYDVAVPIGMVDRVQRTEPGGWLDARSTWWLEILGRLQPGETAEAATQALRRLQPRIREATLPDRWRPENLAQYLRQPFVLAPAANGVSEVRGEYEHALLVVMGVVTLVLLVACANLATLLLARANARRPELSARLVLGASRRRLARQLLTESLLLAAPGGVLGFAIARWGGPLLVGRITSQSGAAVSLDLSLHWRVLLFTLALTMATAMLFGVAPALRVGRLSPGDAIKGQARGVTGEGPGTLAGPLVVAQVALSFVLVFGAFLFLRSFSRLAGRDLGLRSDGILMVSLDAQRSPSFEAERGSLYERAREAVTSVPGVASVAVSAVPPLSGMGWNEPMHVQGAAPPPDRESIPWMNAVTPGWFSTYGTPLLSGRDFDRRDRLGAPPVAIVNEAFARRFLGGGSPLGRILVREEPPGQNPPPLEVVGLVKDALYRSARDAMEPIVYVPLGQLTPEETWPFAALGVRAAGGSPALLARAVADALGRVDPRVSLTFRVFSDQIRESVTREQMVAVLSGFFGGLALLLAAIGLYGVTAYAAGRRRTEIAVRMALGAEARAVVRMVLGRALRLAAFGLLAGAALSLWGSRFVGSLLFGLGPQDVSTLLAAAATLAGISLLASWLPARQAARVDPAQVLREG